ncbi:SA1362 family protein [Halalkalibacterium ligniniphilum]|uniref:SA1362 family protein n=1 Tax=Halalkalibacterium ligniniphilum TaxID=1134413 RepID=UPI0003450B6D|nr:SA1362 family protein [Halalkalibacterium ligniniphilum]
MRQAFHPLILTIFGLAILGLISSLITDPVGLLTQVVTVVAIAALLFFLFQRFMAQRNGGRVGGSQRPSSAQLRKAKRTSTAAKVEKRPTSLPAKLKQAKKQTLKKPSKKRREGSHLTVIEGKKNKKKNRALF